MRTVDEAERITDLLTVLEGRMTELVSAVRGMQLNGVLDVELITFPATGRVLFDFAVPVASIAVNNHTASAITIATGPDRETVPVTGVGVQMVNAGKAAVMALAGACFTLYGPAGGQVSVQVYTTPQPPSFT